MKHRVKVLYVIEIEAESQDKAIREATYRLPESTTNITIECWTPNPKPETPAPEVATDTAELKTA